MKTHAGWAALLLCLLCVPPSALAADRDRYVADTMAVESSPTGETVVRLVSQNRQTVQQFWVNSVYGAQDALVVFDGRSGTPAPSPTPAHYARQPLRPAPLAGPHADAHNNSIVATQ